MTKRMSILLFFIFSINASPIFAVEEYVVGVGDYEYLPYHTIVDHKYSGFAREVLDLFAQKYGYRLTYRVLPWKRVIHEYINKNVDCIFPDNPNWDTEPKEGKNIYYSNAVVSYIDGVVVRPQNKGAGLNHIKMLGTIRGFTPWDYLEEIKSGQLKLTETSDFIPLLKQVLLGRIDGAYIEISVAKYYLHNYFNEQQALVFDPDLPHTKDNYYLSSIKHPELIQAFNVFLESEKKNIEQIKKRYQVGGFSN